MIEAKNIHHFALCVFQTDVVVSWYANLFGFTIEKQFEMGGANKVRVTHLTNNAGIRLELVEFPSSDGEEHSPRSINAPGLSHVALGVDDVSKALNIVKKLKVPVMQGVTEVAEVKVKTAWIRDVEGNAIELVEKMS